MNLFLPRGLGAIVGASALLLGSQELGAECTSATFADEVYYSCSGELTVMPRRDGEDADPAPESDLTESRTQSEHLDERPAANDANAVNRDP